MSAYEHWLEDYTRRCESLHTDVMRVGQAVLAADARAGLEGNYCTDAGRVVAANHRARMSDRFCLLLWSQGADPELLDALAAEEPGFDLPEAKGLLGHKSSNFHPRIARLTVRLDLVGCYAMMLWPEGRPGAPIEPLKISPPHEMNMWYYVFSYLAELAHAVIIEANYGGALLQELSYLHRMGLDRRVLCFDNNDELYRLDGAERWRLEDLAGAVAFAAGDAAT